ncbi:MAG: hypothetical protein QXW98_06090 [Candidatus Caldarchaeum sp.]
MEIQFQWQFSWTTLFAGAFGGFIYAVFRDELSLPKVERDNNRIALGLFRSVLLGLFVGFVVDTHPLLSCLMGFSFNDVIVSIQRRVRSYLQDKLGDTDTHS